VLVLFFVSSSALSALPPRDERGRRGARQVLANGSLAALAAAAPGSAEWAGIALLGAVAAATADTWATEIGVRYGGRPRSILTLRPQSPGTSGAVSPAGTLAALAGALAIAAAGRALVAGVTWGSVAAVALAGFAGCTVDSVLGAGPQAVYECSVCGATPQVARHAGCATPARRVAGCWGLDNDAVNWLGTLTGAAAAAGLAGWLT
jgi:uncharacterized membrane protein